MLQRTNKLLIGKDIARTANVTTSTSFATVLANIVDGEVVVLDKNKLPLAAGSTVSDSEIIFICQGTSVTFDYTTETGSAVTGVRKCIFSDAIEGAKVKNYKGVSYVLKVEQVSTWTPTGTCAAGDEFILRLVYKDMPEHPGQFTQTYRYVATTTTVQSIVEGVAAAINGHSGRRVNATEDNSVLTLTGREIPESTTTLKDLDDFSLVEFTVHPTIITAASTTKIPAATGTVAYSTKAEYGSGNWEQIRDLERACLGYKGVMNLTHYPILTPTQDTVLNGYYDLVVIEHDKSYLSPDNQYVKQAPLTTVIALATASTGINALGQSANVVGILNSWMASTPGAFNAITI